MKNLILYAIFLIAQSSIAQGTKHLWSSNDGSISIKVNFSGVDPGGGEFFYFIVENNTSNDMNVSFNYTFVLSEVSADCPIKREVIIKLLEQKKQIMMEVIVEVSQKLRCVVVDEERQFCLGVLQMLELKTCLYPKLINY